MRLALALAQRAHDGTIRHGISVRVFPQNISLAARCERSCERSCTTRTDQCCIGEMRERGGSVRWSWTLPACRCGSEEACQGAAAGRGCRGGTLFDCAGITPVFKALGGCWPARKSLTPTRSATPASCCSVPPRDSVLIDPGLCHSIGGAAGGGGATVLERAAASEAAICTSKSCSDRRDSMGSIPSHHQAACGGEVGTDSAQENSESGPSSEPGPNSEPDSNPGSEELAARSSCMP